MKTAEIGESAHALAGDGVRPGGRALRTRVRAGLQRGAVPLFFGALVLLFVGRGTLPGQALLPIDNLFLYPPWRAHAAEYGVELPHNPLIGDAILQNISWKRLAADSYAAGQFPLWNPYILSGQPFLATAQNGSLYPLGVLFYVLPLPQAYAWFIGLHLWIAAMGAYWLARTLGATRYGGTIAGATFAFSGFLVVSFLWPMVVSTAVWLPMLLAALERLIQGRRAVPLVVLGALIVGMQFLAGHLEMSLYLLITAGLYTALRLLAEVWRERHSRALVAGMLALAAVALGTGIAAVQLVPFAEVVSGNVRGGWSDYAETVGYALPRERLLTFVVPDYFGNPSHHTYLDLLEWEARSVEHVTPAGEARWDTEWGAQNYVEGTAYLGVLPLLLVVVGLTSRPQAGGRALGVVALLAVLLALGTPLYAVLYYLVPGVNQLHTPFRWLFPASLCLAILAGLGATALGASTQNCQFRAADAPRASRWGVRVGLVAALLGFTILGALVLLLLMGDSAMAAAGRVLSGSPDLRRGFGEARVLFSYQYVNFFGAALLLTASGIVVWLGSARRTPSMRALALILLVGDLFSFGMGFNTVSDTRYLDMVLPPIEAIRADPGLFRVVTYGEDDTLPANTNMLFGLQDIRGYDTIIQRD